MANTGLYKIAADFAVHEGKVEEVEAIRAQMIQHADALDALTFEMLMSDDNRRLTIRTTAQEEEAIRQLLLRIGPDLGQLDAHADVTAVDCAGDVSEALRRALTRFNVTFH